MTNQVQPDSQARALTEARFVEVNNEDYRLVMDDKTAGMVRQARADTKLLSEILARQMDYSDTLESLSHVVAERGLIIAGLKESLANALEDNHFYSSHGVQPESTPANIGQLIFTAKNIRGVLEDMERTGDIDTDYLAQFTESNINPLNKELLEALNLVNILRRQVNEFRGDMTITGTVDGKIDEVEVNRQDLSPELQESLSDIVEEGLQLNAGSNRIVIKEHASESFPAVNYSGLSKEQEDERIKILSGLVPAANKKAEQGIKVYYINHIDVQEIEEGMINKDKCLNTLVEAYNGKSHLMGQALSNVENLFIYYLRKPLIRNYCIRYGFAAIDYSKLNGKEVKPFTNKVIETFKALMKIHPNDTPYTLEFVNTVLFDLTVHIDAIIIATLPIDQTHLKESEE